MQIGCFCAKLLLDKQTNNDENMSSLTDVKIIVRTQTHTHTHIGSIALPGPLFDPAVSAQRLGRVWAAAAEACFAELMMLSYVHAQ